MKLGQPETLGVLNHHHRSIGHIYTYLNHGGSHHYLCLTGYEQLHLSILFSRFHLSMHLANPTLGKLFTNMQIPFFKILQVNLFAFLNQRVDNIDLPAFGNLLVHGLIQAYPTAIKLMKSDNRFTSGRQFIDDRHIQVAIKRHCQCAGNRGCRHHQYMGRLYILCPQACPLGHTETMLLINHNQTERSKIHRIFNDGMGTYQYMYVSRQQTDKDSFAPLALNRTGQQFHTYLHSIQQLTDGFIVLVCQNLGRCHHACLKTIIERHQHTHQCDKRLSTSHIPLQQAVHLLS